jgi:protocatechuate 3,4-dioxygenase beta subunit
MASRATFTTLAIGLALASAAPAPVRSQVVGRGPAGQAAPPRDRPPAPQTGTATIRGRIIAADTRQPLSRARISLSAPELTDGPRTTSTNRDGRYEVGSLPAGRYTISVSRSGYLSLLFGQRRPLEQGKTFEVLENQHVDGVDFLLPRMSLITGRITDEVGEPIAGVSVRATRLSYFNGRRQLIAVATGSTDDDGQYRLLDLMPGTYILQATVRETWTVSDATGEHLMSYAPTYFPGTTSAGDSRSVTVGTGQEAHNTDFSLIPGRVANISGTAYDSRGRPLQSTSLVQAFLGSIGGNVTISLGAAGTVGPDGAFVIRNVSPGEYFLQAAGSQELVTLPVVVNGVDVDNIALVGSPGWSMTGRIVMDDGTPPAFSRYQTNVSTWGIGVLGAFTLGGPGRPQFSQTLNDNWTFSLTGISGPARLRVILPAGWMLKAAFLDGRDVADTPLDPNGGEALSNVQVIVTTHVANLAGQITDDAGGPVVDGTVVLFANDPQKWYENSRWVRTVRPDQKGRYQVTGVLPGDYLAVAVDYVEQGIWNDPDYLGSLRRLGKAVTLSADRPTADLPLTLVTP